MAKVNFKTAKQIQSENIRRTVDVLNYTLQGDTYQYKLQKYVVAHVAMRKDVNTGFWLVVVVYEREGNIFIRDYYDFSAKFERVEDKK